MLVCKRNIQVEDIKRNCLTEDLTVKFIRSNLPEKLKYNENIINNSRFYFAVLIASDESLTTSEKDSYVKMLTKDIRIIGIMNEYIGCDELDL